MMRYEMSKRLSHRTYEVLTLVLTFVCGTLLGGLYGRVLTNQQWKEAMESAQTQQVWDQYR